jgi:hypothetical protein
MAVEKNIRIQLFSPGGIIISDRMVKQLPEFYAGPKDTHHGPLRIEFTLEDKDDVNGSIEYLRRLSGDLPLKAKGGSTSTAKKDKPGADNDLQFDNNKEQIIIDVLQRNDKNQDELIKELRSMGFIFVTSDFLKFTTPDSYTLKEAHKDKFQWLIRRTKEAKDPKNDKYDPQVLIGISIMDKRSDRVVTYFYGEYKDSFRIAVPEKKPMKLSKTNLIKFPHYMEEDERLKWGQEHRLLFNNPEKKPSKFYMRWQKDTVVGDELAISSEDLHKRLDNE